MTDNSGTFAIGHSVIFVVFSTACPSVIFVQPAHLAQHEHQTPCQCTSRVKCLSSSESFGPWNLHVRLNNKVDDYLCKLQLRQHCSSTCRLQHWRLSLHSIGHLNKLVTAP